MQPATSTFLKNLDKDVAQVKAEMNSTWSTSEREKIAYRWACDHGWYDWFCKEPALIGRTAKYGKLIQSIVKAVPILGKNTFVSFSQRLGEGYIDYFHIGRENPDFGYGVRIDSDGYYVYREGRDMGADFESKSFREVVKFIEKDVIIWLAGGKTREYDNVPRSYLYQKNSTSSGAIQSRIKATKPFMVVPGSPVGNMVLKYRAKARKSKKR